jgi:antitoxin ParD1/3/4
MGVTKDCIKHRSLLFPNDEGVTAYPTDRIKKLLTKWKRHHAAISKNEDASVTRKNCYFLLDAFVIQAMRTLTISLSPQQIARLHGDARFNAVVSGAYATNNEVIRDALRLWEQREEARQMEMSRLKKAYDEGMASGKGREVDAATLLAELKAEARKAWLDIFSVPPRRGRFTRYLAFHRARQ